MADSVVLGRYFVLAGSIRFAIEFVRINLRILGPLTLAQLIALSLDVIGMTLILRNSPGQATVAAAATASPASRPPTVS
jgi:prolipoprotein diacylglyceryltransferase